VPFGKPTCAFQVAKVLLGIINSKALKVLVRQDADLGQRHWSLHLLLGGLPIRASIEGKLSFRVKKNGRREQHFFSRARSLRVSADSDSHLIIISPLSTRNDRSRNTNEVDILSTKIRTIGYSLRCTLSVPLVDIG
jgi:hypothetical protein